jgi:geranylgeranyl diphosphate synthase type I
MTTDLSPYLEAIEQELQCAVEAPTDAVSRLYQMMAYHLGWLDRDLQPEQAYRGKRLRPLLCLLACEAAGGDWQRAIPAAAAVELIHNFSLIHDDIEDDSPTRRGRTAVWKLWGVAHGINVGDSLLVLGRLTLGRLIDQGLDSSTVLQAMHLLDQTCADLCQGQYMDMAGEGQLQVTEEWYLQMIGAKTAALIAASTELGAMIAGAAQAQGHLRHFGWYLGLSFQMVDDVLGVWGDPATTGKPAASDIRARKMTLPAIHALQAGGEGQRLADLFGQEHLGEQDVAEAVTILERLGARAYAENRAAEFEQMALAALDAAGARGPPAEHLHSIAESLTLRRS